MPRILLLIPDLGHGGAARQVSLLGAHWPRDKGDLGVVVLGPETPWTQQLRQTGCRVEVLGRQRPFDVAPYLGLRRLLGDFRPDVIHAWGAAALRGLAMAGGPRGTRLVLSGLPEPNNRGNWLDRWLARRAMLAVMGQAAAARHRQLGVPEERLAVLLPAVEDDPGTARAATFPSLPEQARVLLTLGPFHAHKGHREAVWALDILHYLYEDLHLVLLGGGGERDRVIEFSTSLGVTGHVHFPGAVADVRPWLRRAEIVWVPSRSGGGVNAALEAMAAGKPVVATRLPALAEVVSDGATGLLFDPGDKADLARKTRQLLDDAGRRTALGEAGRRLARDCFSVGQLIETCSRLYS